MNHIYLCNFKEYGAEDAPSISEISEQKPYEGKEKIVDYLANNGKATLASAKLPNDRITGERIKGIKGGLFIKETDRFAWWSDLAYHVEKYNLRLPKEFEDYVLNQ